MYKKTLIFLFLIVVFLGSGALFIYIKTSADSRKQVQLVPNPTEGPAGDKKVETPSFPSVFQKDPLINILLIGTDTSLERRNNGQYGYNTDATVLVSIDTASKNVLLTSVPRDLWVNNNKINALFVNYGWEGLKKAYEDITGLQIGGYIAADFDGFQWFITQMGGIDVNIKTSFTDISFPNRQDTDIIQVSFEQGTEKMTGERALTYARSRKGSNGEGSDLMRAKRQHLILQGIVDSFENPGNIFRPMDITGFYNTVTKHMETNLTIGDAVYLWDFYAFRKDYNIRSFVLDDTFIYHPGIYPDSPYTAWVFIPRDSDYSDIHDAIKNKLAAIEPPIFDGPEIQTEQTRTNIGQTITE
ncbi:MAG: cell envelope-related transcriptional attenuator [uncultured bacterium]|uniref:LytR family transcriptional regulator n=1 Tax=candidate division WWE3 bacterium TaxID=2053526 RepID=A0A656PL59_UNCKA|nr:cell envelope-related transcriptional attenuator [candidate division WWE3 bacterium RAAC2_WWE3_1]EKD94720.1 MAG: cell envelope-related transcriptional attenuator [uncultured bacterium]KKS30198.1 MAG: Cell envelope-related transcriptional attenuator [candidate division WWE3 bacterium GW2011_GWB1_42_117]KKS55246.1 MAG: Cell envelope-related transcriptional attenuator [candidate division WWE3 bacterium GW2011_GWD2_42_34]KKT05798.1 MAG: Cell envelope-related transcriptional attenuator [candidate